MLVKCMFSSCYVPSEDGELSAPLRSDRVEKVSEKRLFIYASVILLKFKYILNALMSKFIQIKIN